MHSTSASDAHRQPQSDQSAESRLLQERLKLLYATNFPTVLAGAALACFFGWLLWPYAPPWAIVAWVAAVLVTQAVRLMALRAFERADRAGAIGEPAQWARLQTWLHLAIGLAWGVGAGSILPNAPLIHQSVVILFFGGAATAGIFVAMHLPAYLAYIVGALVPLTIGIWVGAPGAARSLAVMLILYMVVAVVIGRQVARMADRIFQLRIDNEALVAELQRQATTDALTGAANRREFMRRAQLEIERAQRNQSTVAIIGLDLDRFKAVNDRFGHAVGDSLLTAVAAACRAQLRSNDLLGRLGGEEFAVLLPDTDAQRGAEVAERLRRDVAATTVNVPGQAPVAVTASLGLADTSQTGHDLAALFARADQRLYGAKSAGRNRLVTGRCS